MGMVSFKKAGKKKNHEKKTTYAKKSKDTQASTVMLKIPIHYEGCAHKINRIISNIKGLIKWFVHFLFLLAHCVKYIICIVSFSLRKSSVVCVTFLCFFFCSQLRAHHNNFGDIKCEIACDEVPKARQQRRLHGGERRRPWRVRRRRKAATVELGGRRWLTMRDRGD
ncbi:hypothetical protein LXL04_036963 [Taraxacum kok-saghyz]